MMNYLHTFLKRLRGDPGRDWIVMLVCSVLALAIIVVWNAWAFDTVARGGVIGTPSSATPSPFDMSSFDTIQRTFVARAKEQAKYETGTYHFTDPSQ